MAQNDDQKQNQATRSGRGPSDTHTGRQNHDDSRRPDQESDLDDMDEMEDDDRDNDDRTYGGVNRRRSIS